MARRASKAALQPGADQSAARRNAILADRAARLANRAAAVEAERPAARALICAVGPNLYGLPLEQATKIKPFVRAGAAPALNRAVLGLVADEGQIRPALDLGALLGAPEAAVEGGWLVLLGGSGGAALRVKDLPVAADVEPLEEPDAGRARILTGEHRDKVLVMLSASDLLDRSRSPSHGANAP